MDIISRAQAKEQGLPRYFTGKPCKNGHVSERNTGQGTCLSCGRMWKNAEFYADPKKIRDRNNETYKKHRLTIRENRAKKRAENIEDVRKQQKDWYAKNQPIVRARRSKIYFQNPEKIINANKAYAKTHPEVARVCGANRRAKKASGGKHTAVEIITLAKKQKYKCACGCGVSIKHKRHVDHIIPLSRGGDNTIKNIQLLAPRCNLRKHAKDPIIWAQSLGRLL